MSLLKEIIKNRSQILEGIINKIQAKEEITKIANERKEICKSCPLNSDNAKEILKYSSERIDYHCILCGCNIELKTHSLSSECPANPPKWNKVFSDEESNIVEDFINKDPTNE